MISSSDAMKEREVRAWSGAVVLVALLVSEGVLGTFVSQALAYDPAVGAGTIVLMCVVAIGFGGFFVVDPNESKVLQFFGNYVGTVKSPGLKWANPLYTKRRLSMRAVSQESNRLKVNDHDGNPIEIAAIVVWRVVDTAKASFQVVRYDQYVQVQCEAALRNL